MFAYPDVFFFVSDVLRQIIENGGISSSGASKKPKKLPLLIPFEKRDQFNFSEKPIPVSEIATRINDLVDTENMKKLSYSGILNWLTEIGMIEFAATSDGKQTKRPTQLGRENGISVEERIGAKGPYQVIVYNIHAQHFIVDNLDSILNNQAELQGSAWTKDHDECLVDLYKKAVPMNEIAITLKRSTSAIRSRLKKLGVLDLQ